MFDTENTCIIGIDMQEKLVNMLSDKSVADNSFKLLKTASILDVNTILTEQYPKGLGSTIDKIKEIKNFKTIEKVTFSVLKTEEFKIEFEKNNLKNILLFGIETHICVLQSAFDMVQKGCSVYIVKDCCASRSKENNDTALEYLKQIGCKIITLEIAIFEFLKTSKHPCFKEVQSLIK